MNAVNQVHPKSDYEEKVHQRRTHVVTLISILLLAATIYRYAKFLIARQAAIYTYSRDSFLDHRFWYYLLVGFGMLAVEQ